METSGKGVKTEAGDRVELVSTTDPYTGLEPGSFGTAMLVDDAGTVHVKWDDGRILGLVPGEDEFLRVE